MTNLSDVPPEGDIDSLVEDVMTHVFANAVTRKLLTLLDNAVGATGLVDARTRIAAGKAEFVDAVQHLQARQMIEWRAMGNSKDDGKRPVAIQISALGRSWLSNWQRLCASAAFHLRGNGRGRESRDARVVFEDLLDDLLGLQLPTEMLGDWDDIRQSSFAHYAVHSLEAAAQEIGWCDPGYWKWRAALGVEPTRHTANHFQVLELLTAWGQAASFKDLRDALGWPAEYVSKQIKKLNAVGLIAGKPGADCTMSYAATSAGFELIGREPHSNRPTPVVERLVRDLNEQLGPECPADWLGGDEE